MKKTLFLLLTLFLTLFSLANLAHSGTDGATYLPMITGSGQGQEEDEGEGPETRESSRHFFMDVYLASEGAQAQWTGNHGACDAGSTAQAFREAILLRINYFRVMAGVPELDELNDAYNQKAQQAALMMSANDRLSHGPTPDWECYTSEGAEAAGSSNLYLGIYGVAAIDGYIRDPGEANYRVGHRRWILYPQTRMMGTGDVPPADGYRGANALWVFDEHIWDERPETREPYVAWPPPGYVPWQVVYPRWSLSYADAEFGDAEVSMTHNGAPLAVDVQPVETGVGENTVVWEPDTPFGMVTPEDVTFTVEVSNVVVDGETRSFEYEVVVFDPDPDADAAAVDERGELGPALRWP